jgi:hypothetical protein
MIDLTLSAEYSHKHLLKNADFLMKTPHISRRIQSLILADEWWVYRRAHLMKTTHLPLEWISTNLLNKYSPPSNVVLQISPLWFYVT